MHECKSLALCLANYFVLIEDQSPTNYEEIEYMNKILYSNAIGSIMYLMLGTRPNLSFTMSILSRVISNLGPNLWEVLKWLLGYIEIISNIGLIFKLSIECVKLKDFVDMDRANR